MAETERGRASGLRQLVFTAVGVTPQSVTCWVTGQHVPVKNAHIIPDSTKDKVMRRLQLPPSFKNDTTVRPSNFMILDAKLEEAFDTMKISFMPDSILTPTQLKLKIWDVDCRSTELGSGDTIGDYEGSLLNVPSNWSVSKRALSYQSLCCYVYHKYRGTLPAGEDEPLDFSSQPDEGKDKVRKELVEMYETSIRLDEVDNEEKEDVEKMSDDEGIVKFAMKKKTIHRCTMM